MIKILHNNKLWIFCLFFMMFLGTIYILITLVRPDSKPVYAHKNETSSSQMNIGTGSIEYVGSYGGGVSTDSRKFQVKGNYAYTASHHHLLVFDISNPSEPELIFRSSTFPYKIRFIIIYGDYAYLLSSFKNGLGHIAVWDISNPNSPSEILDFDISGAYEPEIIGNYLFVMNSGGPPMKLTIFDLSYPTFPSQINQVELPLGNMHTMTLVDNQYAYVCGDGGFHIIDVSDIYNIEVISEIPDYPRTYCDSDIEINGDYAYLSTNDSSILVIDISDPYHPRQVSSFIGNHNIEIQDNYLFTSKEYLNTLNTGIYIYDISNPIEPVIVSEIPTPHYSNDIYLNGNIGFFSEEGGDGFVVYDISNHQDIIQLSKYESSNLDEGFFDQNAFFIDYPNLFFTSFSFNSYKYGFGSLNIETSTKPYLIWHENFDYIFDYIIAGWNSGYLYIKDPSSNLDGDGCNLLIYDTSEDNGPSLIGNQLFQSICPERLFFDQDLAFSNSFSDLQYHLNIFNFSDPTSPSIMGSVVVDAFVFLDRYGDYLFLSSPSPPTIQVIDIHDPGNPSHFAQINLKADDYIEDTDIAGNNLIIATRKSGVLFIDITDVSNMSVAGQFDIILGSFSADWEGLLVGTEGHSQTSLLIIDIHNLNDIFVSSKIIVNQTPSTFPQISNISLSDGYIYFILVGTLEIYQYKPGLDFPVDYSGKEFAIVALGNYGFGGRVNSWFDHLYPNYEVEDLTVSTWIGKPFTATTVDEINSDNCDTGVDCYNGHNGIDIQRTKANEEVYSAAPGIVAEIHDSYPIGGPRGRSYGNYVLIDHGGGYATFYAHLSSVNSELFVGKELFDIKQTPIGVMGGTGGWSIHLHFGVYYDANQNGEWEENYQGYTEAVDPYGWIGSEPDPNDIPSSNLWKYPLLNEIIFNSLGGVFSSLTGYGQITVPQNSVEGSISFELWDTPIPPTIPSQLLPIGHSIWLRESTNNTQFASSNQVFGSIIQPFTVSFDFSDEELMHIDANQIQIFHLADNSKDWSELSTNIDLKSNTANASANKPGLFALFAPPICPSDPNEINDSVYSSTLLEIDEDVTGNIIDSHQDEDWFAFPAIGGSEYEISVNNLSATLSLIIEFYDNDGFSLLQVGGDFGAGIPFILNFKPQHSGVNYLRVYPAEGSETGCMSQHSLTIDQTVNIYFPVIQRDVD